MKILIHWFLSAVVIGLVNATLSLVFKIVTFPLKYSRQSLVVRPKSPRRHLQRRAGQSGVKLS